jgi:hypothetical protein
MTTAMEITENAVEQLAPYLAKSNSAPLVTEADAPVYLKDMVNGIILASRLFSECSLRATQAKHQRKRAEAVAYLEKYPAYIAEKGQKKGTVAEIEAFVTLDQEVQQAQDKEAYFDSLSTYLLNVRQSLILSHDDVKKSVYSRSLNAMDRSQQMA